VISSKIYYINYDTDVSKLFIFFDFSFHTNQCGQHLFPLSSTLPNPFLFIVYLFMLETVILGSL